jgi:apolipoprotein N-acyltransferase
MLKNLGLSLLSAFLLWLAWPESNFTFLLFFAFIPLLFLERNLTSSLSKKASLQLFLYSFLSFGLWNLLTLLWLFNAHWSAVLAAIIINGSGMGLVMVLFRYIKKKLGNQRAYIALPFFWICFETLHKSWDFSFPWLTLGNGFAEQVKWIQWYEWTGVFGGTLWIWLTNLLGFWILSAFAKHRQWKPLIGQSILFTAFAILLPILISTYTYNHYEQKGEKANVVVVQPNFNTYTEKFVIGDYPQLAKFKGLAVEKLDSTVDFLVGPETLLPDGMSEDKLAINQSILALKQLLTPYPNLNMLIGASTLKYYEPEHKTITARPSLYSSHFYDLYNSALFVNASDSIAIYHKSKLVAGVEMMPLIGLLKPILGDVVTDMGGTASSLAKQDYRENFYAFNDDFVAAPNICWESDFGEYTGEYVRKGANLIFILTNDDWWEDTQGHRQHLHYARLRAIENRRSIARSANTGTSCFINQRGDVSQALPYRVDGVIKEEIYANNELTYYTKSGDVLSRLSLFMASFFLLFSWVKSFLQKRQTPS